jgi:hypothetical protein
VRESRLKLRAFVCVRTRACSCCVLCSRFVDLEEEEDEEEEDDDDDEEEEGSFHHNRCVCTHACINSLWCDCLCVFGWHAAGMCVQAC